MAIHHVIVADLLNTHNDSAVIDVASDDAQSATVRIGSTSQTVTLDGTTRIGSSTDLLAGSPTLPALVTVDAGDVPIKSAVVLRQRKLVLVVPSKEASHGVQFRFPLGDEGNGAFLLVGNPSATDATVTVRIGANPSLAPVVCASGTVARIPLTGAPARVLVATNGVPVILQLAVTGRGQEFSMSPILPGG